MKDDEKTKDKDALGKSTVKKDDKKLSSAVSNKKIRDLAEAYMKSKGMSMLHPKMTFDVSPERGAKIAKAYEEMKHEPENPKVKKAYDALIRETLDQWNEIRKTGLKVTKIAPDMDNPYPGGSKDVIKDIAENNHLFYFPTEQGYGSTDQQATSHPMLQKVKVDGEEVPANDVFRIVHDYFGHVKEGHGFGPQGEENAWMTHKQMYSPEARKALTSETRGQNSWVNFGPLGEQNRKDPSKTTYAEQKAGLMPDWVVDEESTTGREKMADGGRVMMQDGGDPGQAIDISESPLFQQDLQGASVPLPTPIPTATPQPSQFQPQTGAIDISESPLFQQSLQEAPRPPEGDLSAPTPSIGVTPAGKEKPLATTFTREYAPVWDVTGPEPKLTTVPHDQVMTGVLEGRYAFDKAASVPMKFADGEVVAVPADKVQDALANQLTYATPKDIAHFKHGDETGIAFAEGLARGVLSAPVTTAIEKAFGVDPEAILARQELGAATAGEFLGFTAPLLLTGGTWAAGKAGLSGVSGALKGASKIASMAPYPMASNILGGAAAKGIAKATTGLPKFVAFTAAEAGRGALEMGLYDAQSKLSNYMLGAPPDDSILASLGMSSLLGGAIGGGIGMVGYKLGKMAAGKPTSGLSTIMHHGRPGEPIPMPEGGIGPSRPPSGAPAEMPVFTPEEVREAGVATPRWITQSEAPPGAAPMPEGYFPPQQELPIQLEPPREPSQVTDDITEAIDTFGGQPKIELEEPKGLFSESFAGGWIPPHLAEGVANGNTMALVQAFPEEIMPRAFGVEVRGMDKSQLRKWWENKLEKAGFREKSDAEATKAAVSRLTNGQVAGDQVPLTLTVHPTGAGKLIHMAEQIIEETPAAFGVSGARTPAENKGILFQSIDDKILQLLGEHGGKDPVSLGRAMLEAIQEPLAAKNAALRGPYMKYENALRNMPLLDSERAALKQIFENKIKSLRPDQKNMIKPLQEGIEVVTSTTVPTMGELRNSMKNFASQAFEPLERQIAQEGYWEAWKILKDFERSVGENLHLDFRLDEALRAELLRDNTWEKKLLADKQWMAYLDDLRFLAQKLKVPKNQLTEVAQILKGIKEKSVDEIFNQLSIQKLNYNDLMRIADKEKGFPRLASIIRSAEKQKLLAKGQEKKSGGALSSFVADMKKMNKVQRAFTFENASEMQAVEDLLQVWRNFGEKNWSNTEIMGSVNRALTRAQQGAMIGGLPGAAAAVAGEFQKGTLANIFLKQARKTVRKNPRGRWALPAEPGATTPPPKEPKKYAEGGMVTADEPMYDRRNAFVQAVNQPPHIQEANRIVNAIVKSDKMITNSVKSIFDPKSAYKIAPPNPKGVEKLKGYVDQIHNNPESLTTLGSEIAPEFNSAVVRSASSAAQFIKSLEPRKPQTLPFDSGVKDPPSAHVDIYNHVLKVTEQPLYVLHKVKNGTVIPEEIQAVQTIYPDLYQRLQNQITEHLVDAKNNGATIPYKTKIGLSAFLGSPIDTTFTPESIQAAQPMQQNQPPQGAQTGAQPKRSTSALGKMATMAQTPGQARAAERSSGK